MTKRQSTTKPNNAFQAKKALKQLRKAWVDFSYFKYALRVLEKYLNAADPALQAATRQVLVIATQYPDDRKRVAMMLVPILIQGLSDSAPRIREASATALSAVPRQGGDIHSALPALVTCLSDPIAYVAEAAAHSLFSCTYYDYDLRSIRPALEANLSNPNRYLRHDVALALSHDLQRSGEEEPLPHNCSHRRLYAANDEPLPNIEHICNCGVCGSKHTRCIYYDGCGSLAGTHQMWEYLCLDCGKYTICEYDTG